MRGRCRLRGGCSDLSGWWNRIPTTAGGRERARFETCAVVLQVGFIASLKNELKHEIVSQVGRVVVESVFSSISGRMDVQTNNHNHVNAGVGSVGMHGTSWCLLFR